MFIIRGMPSMPSSVSVQDIIDILNTKNINMSIIVVDDQDDVTDEFIDLEELK